MHGFHGPELSDLLGKGIHGIGKVDIPHIPAGGADEMMMVLHVGIVTGPGGENRDFGGQSKLLKGGKRSIHGIQGDGLQALAHLMVEGFSVRVIGGLNQLSEYQQALRSELDPRSSERFLELLHSPGYRCPCCWLFHEI